MLAQIRTASAFVEVLLLGVSLAVAAVPEVLSAIMSLVLALGVQRMARHHAIVEKLSSVETLGDLTTARTAGFTVLVLESLFICFGARSEVTSAFANVFVNKWLWGAVVASAAMHVAVVHVGFLNVAFGTAPWGTAKRSSWSSAVGERSVPLSSICPECAWHEGRDP